VTTLPRFIKLKFPFDKERLRQEVLSCESKFRDIPANREGVRGRPFDLVPRELYDEITYFDGQTVVKGRLPSWRGLSFTHIPGVERSLGGSNVLRTQDARWEFRTDLTFDYLKSLIKVFGFSELQNIRAMVLDPPGFGPVHIDLAPTSNYYEQHVSVTLSIDDGGQPLAAFWDGEYHHLSEDCFVFRDDCWHGVGIVTRRRIQVRINGRMDPDQLRRWID
jgi:hypothetical protein